MEIKQSPSNQNLTETEIQPRQASSNNSRLFMVITISVLLTAMIAGSVVYFWQRSTNEGAINSLEQKITSLEEQISTMKKEETSPQPTLSPVLSPEPTQSTQNTTPTLESIDNQPPRGVISGVDEGSVISTTLPFGPFCTKSLGYDNVTKTQKLLMRNKLNDEDWSNWSLNYERCWQYLENGEYTYSVQFKDEVGNESEIFSKTFTVKNTD